MSFPLSIIIPTHKRPNTLRLCLEALEKQTVKDFEVVIVCDGPDSKTDELIAGLKWDFEMQYFSIPKSHQGVARNRGVEKARGKLSLLIGDDFLLLKDAVERHLTAHERIQQENHEEGRPNTGAVVLGYSTWDPAMTITPLMRWMERTGVQFGYDRIASYAGGYVPQDIQHFFTYTSNVSLPSRLLWLNRFREDVSLYGWEDIEWGWRLAQEGIPLFYESGAKALHRHTFSDAEVWERSRKIGASARTMEQLVPELRLTPRGFKKLAYIGASLLPTYRGRHCRAFLRGMRRGA